MALKAGEVQAQDKTPMAVGSLAGEIEKAFLDRWHDVMGDLQKPESNRQMQLLFVAVAHGVVKHLQDNPSAFKFTFNFGSTTVTGSLSSIE